MYSLDDASKHARPVTVIARKCSPKRKKLIAASSGRVAVGAEGLQDYEKSLRGTD